MFNSFGCMLNFYENPRCSRHGQGSLLWFSQYHFLFCWFILLFLCDQILKMRELGRQAVLLGYDCQFPAMVPLGFVAGKSITSCWFMAGLILIPILLWRKFLMLLALFCLLFLWEKPVESIEEVPDLVFLRNEHEDVVHDST